MNRKKFRTEHLPFGSLKIHPRVQRSRIPALVKKRVNDWNPMLADGISISIHDRQPFVIDGQHRVAAAMEKGLAATKVLCHIYTGLTEEEEAGLFLGLNDARYVTPADRFFIGLLANDPLCLEVEKIAHSHGLRIAERTGDGQIACVSTVMTLAKSDTTVLNEVLGVIVESWGTRPASFERPIVQGIGQLFSRFNGEIDKAVLSKKLGRYRGGPTALVGSAKGLREFRSQMSLPGAVAQLIHDEYNRNRRKGALSPL